MDEEYRAPHRIQGLEGAWAAKYGCTAVAGLVAMDQATQGRIGPGITADALRARQSDQAAGIDLHDLRIAAATYGVRFDVFAAYGGTQAATYNELVTLGAPAANRALVIQGDHGALPADLRCSGFLGPHAVESPGWAIRDGARVWLVSNPLCPGYRLWSSEAMRAFTAGIAGEGLAYVAAAPQLRPTVRVRRGLFWRYQGATRPVGRRQWFTRGFTLQCSPPIAHVYGGRTRRFVRVTQPGSSYRGDWLDLGASGVEYRAEGFVRAGDEGPGALAPPDPKTTAKNRRGVSVRPLFGGKR